MAFSPHTYWVDARHIPLDKHTPYTVARYHPQGPMFEANGQRAFAVFFAPPVPRKNIKLLQAQRELFEWKLR